MDFGYLGTCVIVVLLRSLVGATTCYHYDTGPCFANLLASQTLGILIYFCLSNFRHCHAPLLLELVLPLLYRAVLCKPVCGVIIGTFVACCCVVVMFFSFAG